MTNLLPSGPGDIHLLCFMLFWWLFDPFLAQEGGGNFWDLGWVWRGISLCQNLDTHLLYFVWQPCSSHPLNLLSWRLSARPQNSKNFWWLRNFLFPAHVCVYLLRVPAILSKHLIRIKTSQKLSITCLISKLVISAILWFIEGFSDGRKISFVNY